MNEIKLRPGKEFVYNGIRFICLDIIDGNYLAIAAECWCEKRFNEEHLIKQTSDLVADNGDKAYGTCEDYITLLTCDQYRKYRDYVPLFEECMWTLTPWRCDPGDASLVRNVDPTGAIYNYGADYSFGLAPVCLFNSNNLTLRQQAQLISAE